MSHAEAEILVERLRLHGDLSHAEAEILVEKFRKLIDPYQEQPELLEPYLAELIQKLTSGLDDFSISSDRYHTIFKFLYQLIKVNGFKSIGKKFPHETDKLSLIIELLSKEDPQDKANWQTRFVLTVWLSIVILTPFDLSKFDSDSTGPSISERIYSILLRSLDLHDSCQHVTAFCLAKLFSRPDMLKSDLQLKAFIGSALSCVQNVKNGSANSMDDVPLIGYLRTLSYMFKFLPRNEMKLRCNSILDVLLKLDINAINRELVNHLIIKLIQRAGLALLPKRIASWRYKRGSRILGKMNHHQSATTKQDCNINALSAPTALSTFSTITITDETALKPASEQTAEEASTQEILSNEEEMNSAEYLESILSVLFVAAQNAQTRIRWSAAKGIARLASRLSRERASDVMDMVMGKFFDSTSSEFAWHGGCLTLAEMSRHGLILEEKLAQVARIVGDAIIYDKIKGTFVVGAHVREAACYVCWAMARTYEDHLLEPYIPSISVCLLCTMLFDRELQCRRAASATFQELVGRQGTFNEEGINILANVDYQNVGQRQFAYQHLALQVASYGEKYSIPFVKHLLEKKIGHWDVQIRRLASDSLPALMLHVNHHFIQSEVLPHLIEASEQNVDNNAKHGAILGLAKVITGLVPLQFEFSSQLVEHVGSLVKKCERQLKSKQQAPNFMEAVGFVVSSAEAASFHYDDNSEVLKQWESIALQALDSDNAALRDIGSDALLTLYRTYYKRNKTHQDRLLAILNRSLSSSNESSRCGSLRALSKLAKALSTTSTAQQQQQQQQDNNHDDNSPPNEDVESRRRRILTDADTPDIILTSLASYIASDTRESLPAASSSTATTGGSAASDSIVFAEAKAEACEAFVNFVRELDKARLVACLKLIEAGYDALLKKTEDYTFDKRGDIGVVVRRAAIRNLTALTLHLLSIGLSDGTRSFMFNSERVTNLIGRVLQQAVSYNNSAREQAALALYRLVGSDLPDGSVAHKAEIIALFDRYKANDESFNWRDDSTPIFVHLLAKQEYSQDLWIGLLPSVGQISDMCARQFRVALSDYIQSLSSSSSQQSDDDTNYQLQLVFNSLLETLQRKDMADRLLGSGLIVADYLLTQGLISDNTTQVEFQEKLAKFAWNCSATRTNSTGKSDPKRLVSVVRVLSAMLQFGRSPEVQLFSLKCCLTLLLNGYASVRVYTAEQLYLSIMTYQSDLEESLSSAPSARVELGDSQVVGAVEQQADDKPGEDAELDLDEAMQLLSSTNWSEPLEKVRPVRDQICTCMRVQLDC